MKAAREREISETCPQDGHWCKMEDDMVSGGETITITNKIQGCRRGFQTNIAVE
jgi:hypothetical protein